MTERIPEAGQERRKSFGATVLGIAGTVKDRRTGGGMGPGERAELRRMRGEGALPPEPFWRLVDRYGVRAAEEPFWRAVVPLMVDTPHVKGLAPGRALADAGVSPARIERWLRRDRESAWAECPKLLRRLDRGLDWIRFASALRRWDDRARTQIARDFFLSQSHTNRRNTDESKEVG